MSNNQDNLQISSWLVAAGRDNSKGAPLNIPPILTSNYILGDEYGYSRNEGTPAWTALEEVLGGMENGKAIVFSSGMAAISAVFNELKNDSIVVLPNDCYQGVASLAAQGEEKGFWKVEKIEVEDTDSWVKAAKYADLIWLESPSNPLLKVGDLVTICAAERKPTAILAVDNTFATSINQRPLDLGADVSVQSASKFIGGHSDLLAGVITTKDEGLFERLFKTRVLDGATPGAFEVFLALRGLRTLPLRLREAEKNAMLLAERLEGHPKVEKVRYPGLKSHPNHERAKQQLGGFGTIISFDTKGDADAADAFCENLNLIHHATSLGAIESTIERRGVYAGQEHLPPTLLRLSVGIEHVDDLWNDLEQAFQKV